MKVLLEYQERTNIPRRATKVWDVTSKGVELGRVSWYSPWRRFCFFPDPQTLYDASCMKELAKFCQDETDKRKKERKK